MSTIRELSEPNENTLADVRNPAVDAVWPYLAGYPSEDSIVWSEVAVNVVEPVIRAYAKAVRGALAGHDQQIRAKALREAAQAIITNGPGINAELNYDGTTNREMAAYVEGHHDAYNAVCDLIAGTEVGGDD